MIQDNENNLQYAIELFNKNELEEAAELFRQITFFNPNNSTSLFYLAQIYMKEQEYDNALNLLERLRKLYPDNYEIYNLTGIILSEVEKHDEAEKFFRKTIELKTDYSAAYNNLGLVLQKQDKLQKAIPYFELALKYETGLPLTFINLGHTYQELGEYDDAINCYEQALALQNSNALAHWNLALVYLTLGNYEEGWKEYEWGLKSGHRNIFKLSGTKWNGEDLKDKTLLIHYEQGYGDTLQFIRYIKLLKPMVKKIIFLAQKGLSELLKDCEGIDEIIEIKLIEEERKLKYDYYIPLLSLPLFFNTTLTNIPVDIPYIFPDTSSTPIIPIGKNGNAKVGICWRGNPKHFNDKKRSIPIKIFKDLFRNISVDFYSFQKNITNDEEEVLASNNIINLDHKINTFNDTANFISAMDLIITVDTAIAHLAAAMAKPTWVLLPANNDWRWLTEDKKSPWYPTATLFKQKTMNDWEDVIDRTKCNLCFFLAKKVN